MSLMDEDGVEKVHLMCSQSTVLNQGSFFTSFTPEILSENVFRAMTADMLGLDRNDKGWRMEVARTLKRQRHRIA